MSYEGYSQFLCEKGHNWELDCYNADTDKGKKCPHCGCKAVWENTVNVTNGSHDDDGRRIDGYIELEVKKVTVCGACKRPLETTYHLPGFYPRRPKPKIVIKKMKARSKRYEA